MDTRSLVQHGPATLMVSLPAKWLKENKLDKGDQVHIEENGDSLSISIKQKQAKRELELSITSLAEPSIRNILTNSYRLGYDKITLNFENKEVIKIIERIVHENLIGFEITKQEAKKCIVESITEPSKEQFDNIFSKFILNIDFLFDSFKQSLKTKEQDMESTERQIKSFDNFCRRTISKNNEATKTLRWTLHTELQHAQRELYFALKLVPKLKANSKSIEELLKSCKEIYETIKKAYYEKDLKLLEEAHNLERELIFEEGYEILKKSKDPYEKIIMHHILSSSRNFFVALSPLMGLFLISN